MATTKGLICEQIERLLYAGDPSTAARITRADIAKLVEQQSVAALKAARFNENLPEGDVYPTGTMIAEYDAVPVEQYKNVSRSMLPATPVYMPMGMGVWHVGPANDIHKQFIPMQSGQFAMMKNASLLGSNLTGYEPVAGAIIYTEDLTAKGIDTVYMQLLVSDIMSLGEWDILPVTQDMEAQIVANVFQLLMNRPPADRVVDQNDKP